MYLVSIGMGIEWPADKEYVTMKIEAEGRSLTIHEGDSERTLQFDDPEAFAILSRLWLRSAWETKYFYTYSWLGRPIIQSPDDMFRLQELIYALRPDVLIETGVAHGGSLIFYAGLFQAMGSGRVIGIDIDIRAHNRKAIEAHELFHRIDLIEGSSTDPATVDRVRKLVAPGARAIVVLDSNHSRAHVLAELEAYAPFVSPGSYIVATDGIMRDLVGSPRSDGDWETNNPYEATRDFLLRHPEFSYVEPARGFDEGVAPLPSITQWPGAWLRRHDEP